MSELSKIAGRGVYVAGSDIDTDRIIGAVSQVRDV